ncbi:MogA/MoaB family molybdenum cofactor biosynthesis protein [Desulfovibrio psychrotolerans]|uniref:Molybdopterin adenylyltransferase n=1 Tax=Desulfovibrio psychrotolerans TaxID=415242 RepID=A0A7J0BSJ2_9BACT|nr:MogA/MoaB family molybdenum cofactor biosynthesis protein [Desulfovibrio psychrotolerans]GFM36115.1 molybdenum cofactor biosynthesis protein [Desulfovibrio psychrotolerans]
MPECSIHVCCTVRRDEMRFFRAPDLRESGGLEAEPQTFAGAAQIANSACSANSANFSGFWPVTGLGRRPWLPAGTVLRAVSGSGGCAEGADLFRVVCNTQLPVPGAVHAAKGFWAQALADIPALTGVSGGTESKPLTLATAKTGLSIAWVTLSDKGAAGQRTDESGPLIERLMRDSLNVGFAQGFILPDSVSELRHVVTDLALGQAYDVIVTTGGTGVGPRDTTPEALGSLLEKRLYGFEQAMMAASLSKTHNAVISRAVAGTLGGSLIITLPGSRKAVAENLEAVLPAVAHTVAKLQGDGADCGG